MDSEDLPSHLQMLKQLGVLQTAHNNAVLRQFNTDQAKMQAQNLQLVQQINNMSVAMEALDAERNALKEQLGATETAKLGIEKQYDELIGERKIMQGLVEEAVKEDQRMREEHAMQIEDKDLIIQTLETQLAASQEESKNKSMKLLEQHAKELNDKNLVIGDLETHLSAADQRTEDKFKVLEEQHAKQIKGKDLEIQTLQDKLAAGQEQHAKELNDKDSVIQELEARLPAAELQTVDKVMELTNENNRLLQGIQKLQKEKDRAEQRLQGVAKTQEALRQSRQESRSQMVVSEPTSQVHTKLHTELGKLYMELQDAKKPQEVLMGQLAAKNKELEYLTEQHKAKMAAKDSEIQNLKEMIQGGDEMNEKAVVADGQSE